LLVVPTAAVRLGLVHDNLACVQELNSFGNVRATLTLLAISPIIAHAALSIAKSSRVEQVAMSSGMAIKAT